MMTDVPKGLGLGGKTYGKYSAFCLEDQAFPDAVSILDAGSRPSEFLVDMCGRTYRV